MINLFPFLYLLFYLSLLLCFDSVSCIHCQSYFTLRWAARKSQLSSAARLWWIQLPVCSPLSRFVPIRAGTCLQAACYARRKLFAWQRESKESPEMWCENLKEICEWCAGEVDLIRPAHIAGDSQQTLLLEEAQEVQQPAGLKRKTFIFDSIETPSSLLAETPTNNIIRLEGNKYSISPSFFKFLKNSSQRKIVCAGPIINFAKSFRSTAYSRWCLHRGAA